jgi:glyoxylase-like metal-dependent hydrolase (beta-lactamase superfamily II)
VKLRVRIQVLSSFRLDGGAMFGSVPKVLWERERPADEKNRIELVSRVLILEGDGILALVDAGVGDKFTPREREMFAVRSTADGALHFRWRDLTHLIPTHLHFDHAGGLTRRREEGGAIELSAPQARLILQRANWELATAPGPRERASYLHENVEPLRAADLQLLDGGGEVLPGVRVRRSDGHTRGMQWLTAATDRGTVAFPADIIPTTSHLHLPFVMGYDMCVATLLEEKQAFLRQAVEEDWIVVFAHDPGTPAARLRLDERGRFVLGEVVALEGAAAT